MSITARDGQSVLPVFISGTKCTRSLHSTTCLILMLTGAAKHLLFSNYKEKEIMKNDAFFTIFHLINNYYEFPKVKVCWTFYQSHRSLRN